MRTMESKSRTPRQKAISAAATLRAQRVAQERHRRLENARVAKMEQAIIDRYHADLTAFLATK